MFHHLQILQLPAGCSGFLIFFNDGIGPNTPQLASMTSKTKATNPPKKICQKILTLLRMMNGLDVKLKQPQIKYHKVISKLIK